MPFGRLEAQIRIPSGGWTGTIDDSGAGAAVVWSVAAGTYFLPELITAFETALNAAAPTDTLTVTIGNGELGTGRVTIASGGGVFAIVWIATDLRDLLGYTGNLSAASTYLAPNHARSHWIAGCPYRAPNQVFPWAGWPVADFRSVESAAGQVWAFSGQKKEIAKLEWDAVPRARASKANETLVNESFQRFVEDGVWGFAPWGTPGGPIRFFPDASVGNFASYYVTDLKEIRPEQFAEGWDGGPWKVQLPRLVVIGTGAIAGGSSRATIVPNLLTSSSSTTDGTVFATASVSPGANRAVYVGVQSAAGGGALSPTVTYGGTGLTFIQVNTVAFSSATRRITVFRALGAAPTAGAITFTFGATQTSVVWNVIEFDEVDLTGTNGSGATVQSAFNSGTAVTSLAATLAALEHPNNVMVCWFGTDALSSITPDGDFTERSERQESNGSSTLECETAANQFTATATWASANAGVVAIEVKAGPP